jgi:hypothetical protein
MKTFHKPIYNIRVRIVSDILYKLSPFGSNLYILEFV